MIKFLLEAPLKSVSLKNLNSYNMFWTSLMPYRDIIIELVILLSLSILTAFAVNYFSPRGIALFGEWDTSEGVISAKSKKDVISHELEINTVLSAKKTYDGGKAVFVDARSQETFEEGHIKGAVSLPVGRFDEYFDKFKKTYPISSYIVTYCSGRECNDSHKLAQFLLAEGYLNISVFIDGYPAWEDAGYPIE
ncbi:MAG: rhodanese-like domain-containing protein [Proteobacteria bacterium]|nr:rhodanese-like domain-containing protein [Pseudomonadota bacterium]